MKFGYVLPAILLGVANVMALHQATVALTATEVEDIAKQITVRIDGPKNGTGVIIDKQGNTYTVLTNWHVVQAKGNYTVQTQDGRRPYQFSSSQVQRLSGVDLAQLTFTSNQNYRVADRGNSNPNQLLTGTKVYVAGWAEPDNRCRKRCWQFRSGNISGRLTTAKNGYNLSYTNVTKPGMSGGPLLNEEGSLVGINGQSQSDPRTGAVEYVAIPINTYKKLASANTPFSPRTPKPSPTPSVPPVDTPRIGYFTQPPRLTYANTTYDNVRESAVTYYFTIKLPDEAGTPLQKITINQHEGLEYIRFNLKKSFVFEGTRSKKGKKLKLKDITSDKKTKTVSLIFDPPVLPGKTITVDLQARQNPVSEGIYLFGVKAFPVGEKSRGQFLGFGRLHFYSSD